MSTPSSSTDRPRLRLSTVIGAVGVLAVLDIVLLIVLGTTRSAWWPVAIVLADLLAGWLLIVLTGRQAAGRFRELRDALTGAPRRAGSGGSGKPGWTFLAALLVFLPGLLSDAAGLLLLLAPVQRTLSEMLGVRSSGVVVRRSFPTGFDARASRPGRPDAGRGGRPEDIVVETDGADPAGDDENGGGTTAPPQRPH